jgi:environmental stress-induced protein Ves
MKIRCVSKEKFKTTGWSGGETTEFFIYPENSSYAERNFLFRISSATITDDYSIFTKLEGIERHLVVIEGVITLKHNECAGHKLNPYIPHRFSGEWKTESFGNCKDFNLMINGNIEGSLECIRANTDKSQNIVSNNSVSVFYCDQGTTFIEYGDMEYSIDKHTLLVLETEDVNEYISLSCSIPTNVIKASVKLP